MNNLSLTFDGFSMQHMAHPEVTTTATPQKAALAIRESASNEELLIAVGNNQDRIAFNTLFGRFATRIYAMGMKLTRNEQLSNDLVQEAMLMVWQKAGMYDLDRGTAQGWIFTLTRNRCFDLLRKIKRQPACISADDIWPEGGMMDSTEEPVDAGFRQVAMDQIQAFYAQLPETQSAVIEQIYIFDRTHEEAASTLQIPLGTLKSRLRLGLDKLRVLAGVQA